MDSFYLALGTALGIGFHVSLLNPLFVGLYGLWEGRLHMIWGHKNIKYEE